MQIVYNLHAESCGHFKLDHTESFFILKWADNTGCDGSWGLFHKSHAFATHFDVPAPFRPSAAYSTDSSAYSMFSVTPHHPNSIFLVLDRFLRLRLDVPSEPSTGLLRVHRGYRHDFWSPHLSFSTEIMLVYLFFSS